MRAATWALCLFILSPPLAVAAPSRAPASQPVAPSNAPASQPVAPSSTATSQPSSAPASQPAASQPTSRPANPRLQKKPVVPDTPNREFNWAVLPGAFFQQETSLGFAAFNEIQFFTDNDPNSTTSRSRVGLVFAYTLLSQLLIQLPVLVFFDNDKWVFDLRYDYRIYPNRFYGIGNNTPNVYQEFKENVLDLYSEIRRRVHEYVWIGAIHHGRMQFEVSADRVIDSEGNPIEDADPLLGPDVLGFETAFSNGFGASVLVDWRNDVLNSTSGGFYYTSIIGYNQTFSGKYDYARWVVDLRQFIPVIPSWGHVLGVRFLHELRIGNPPFHQMAQLGGPFQNRGIFQGRYRDNNLATLQLEYRLPIYWRFSAALFGAVGQVYGNTAFAFERLRLSGGFGIRFRFGQQIYIRLDFGFSSGNFAPVFNQGQVF